MATLLEESLTVLCLAIESQVSFVILSIGLQNARENESNSSNGGPTSRSLVCQPLGGLWRGITRPDTAETATRAREVKAKTRTIAKEKVGVLLQRENGE